MSDQAVEPGEFVDEFRPRPRIAIGQVKRADQDAVDGRLDIAAVRVVRIPGQTAMRLVDFADAAEDRDVIPALLPMPDSLVAAALRAPSGNFSSGALSS
jgi:hypothetical protein